MRQRVTNLVKVKEGEQIAFLCELKDGIKLARLSVWTLIDGSDLSPYIPHYRIETLQDGKPAFVQPTFFTLTVEHPKKQFDIVADEACMLCIRQEIDYLLEPTANVKVLYHGNALYTLGRHIRDTIRTIRRRAAIRHAK